MWKVCRLCLNNVQSSNCTLISKQKNSPYELQKLRICLPEIDVDLLKVTVICDLCMKSLNDAYHFKCRCLESERRIQDYVRSLNPNNSAISLSNVDLNMTMVQRIQSGTTVNRMEIEFVTVSDSEECNSKNGKDSDNLVKDEIEIGETVINEPQEEISKSNTENLDEVICIDDETPSSSTANDPEPECSLLIINDTIIETKSNQQASTTCVTCDKCNFSFSSKLKLEKHMNYAHSEDSQLYCKSCHFKCASQLALDVHRKTHTSPHAYECELCDYKCLYKSMLRRHLQKHTGNKPFKCDVCDYQCTNAHILKTHTMTHTKSKIFQCASCDFKCCSSVQLNTHKRTHYNPEKLFKCGLCAYACSPQSKLKIHMRTHTGEKPFSCMLCDYKSTTKSNLVVHMRTHTGLKVYSCQNL